MALLTKTLNCITQKEMTTKKQWLLYQETIKILRYKINDIPINKDPFAIEPITVHLKY